MTTRHATTDDLRAAIEAAIPDMTEDQADAATVLLDAQAGSGAWRDDVLDLDNVYRRIAIGALRAAGHPEATR